MEKGGDLHIGTVVGVHGIRGYLKAVSFAENSEPFTRGKQVYVKIAKGGRKAYTVRDYKPYKNVIRIAFETVETRKAAEELVGAKLFINRSELPETGDDTWYWCDLIGLEVYADHAYIGRVEYIFATGSNDVLVVRDDGTERLIPVIESIVRQIDPENKKILVTLPEGL